MSFFDKLFSNKIRSDNNENAFKSEVNEGLSFRSSYLSIPKDQIRFVLFRECDKRGRKLLFDSNSVDKIQLPSKKSMCNFKGQQQNEKFDFIEITKTHGYKYKRPASDVFSLGEMVFGSVAVVYKAKNSCKIHSIPSPKRLMFTAIVHAPFHRSSDCKIRELNLDLSSESSLASLTNILNGQLTSSSDSKLYKHEENTQKYSSTYPWIKHSLPVTNLKQCCEIDNVDCNLSSKFLSQNTIESKGLENLYCYQRTSDLEKFSFDKNFSMFSENNLCLCQKNSDCEKNSLSNCGSSGITSNESGNISSVSGSLSSLRRRWAHSYSTSLDSTSYDDESSSPLKKRTKLGMALILDLSNTLENEIEKLIFNHTIIIDSIMYKLQDSVELAYIKNEHFVDLIYTAFLECQESIYELITGGKYETPVWCTVFFNPEDELETHLDKMNFYKKNLGACSKRSLASNIQLKFLNDFCDMLVKFDTKDTNFFISTLLTAVLTHHLSWVASVVEADAEFSNDKLHVVNGIRPYNPIWAQMNDLCGLLGSPLKSTKTIVTGPENKKNQLAIIIEILNYFIRCNNVVENIYEVDIEEIIGNADLENHETNLDWAKDEDTCVSSSAINFKKNSFGETYGNEPEKCCEESQVFERNLKREVIYLQKNDRKKCGPEEGLKRTKSFFFDKKMKNLGKSEFYPDIKDLAQSENINIDDLDYVESKQVVSENFLSSDKLKEKIQKMIRVPSESVKPYTAGYFSPDEGYNIIDLAKTDNFKENKVQMEVQGSAVAKKSKNIVFLLGENEELINLQKKIVVNKSSFIDMVREDSKEFSSKVDEISASGTIEKNSRTLEKSNDIVDRTFWVNHSDGNIMEHSLNTNFSEHNVSKKPSWFACEMKMPRATRPCHMRQLEVSSVLGGVNQHYNSQQIIQGILKPLNYLEQTLQKDLYLSVHSQTLEKNLKEALCIVGDMDSWEVTIFSSNKSILDFNKRCGIRVGMSQLVADMLESVLYLHTSNLSPSFCLFHIEQKLHEIYSKSKTVAELLNSTELCSMDYLTTSLDISINDVPLLLSVATTHSPHIAEKYTLSYS